MIIFRRAEILTKNLEWPDGPPRNERNPMLVLKYDTSLLVLDPHFEMCVIAQHTWTA